MPSGEVKPQEVSPAIAAFLLAGVAKKSKSKSNSTVGVFTRAVLALAEEGWLAVEPLDGGMATVRIAREPDEARLAEFERLALARVRARIPYAGAAIPLSVLTSDEGEEFTEWEKKFHAAIVDDAARAGLITRFVSPGAQVGISVLLGAAGGLAAMMGHSPHSASLGILAGFFAFVVAGAITGPLARWRLSRRGAAVAAWWRERAQALPSSAGLGGAVIADRVPGGAALPPNSAQSLVANGSEPLPEGQVWSSFGGRWRPVKVGSLDTASWGRPGQLAALIVFGCFFTLPASAIGLLAIGGPLGKLISIGPLTLFGAITVLSWLPAYNRRRAFPTRTVFEGQVVKRWTYESGGEDSTTYYCCCVDDGASQEGWSFRIKTDLYRRLRVGDPVRVDCNPRWHTLNELTLPVGRPG
ncbi:MAG TPA: hypothetical protein VGM10_32525 [Actinocrinis sp.]|jgi:hypothetical protein